MKKYFYRFICIIVIVLLCIANIGCFADNALMSPSEWDKLSDQERNKTIQSVLIGKRWLYGDADGIIGKQSKNAIIKYKYYLSIDDNNTNDILPIDDTISYALYKSLFKEKKYSYVLAPFQYNSYLAWKEIDSLDERGKLYDSIVKDIAQYKELRKQGKTGTKSYNTLSKSLIPIGYEENSYLKTLDKYFTKSDDGIWNFVRDIDSKDSKLIKYSESKSYMYWDMYSGEFYFVPKVCVLSEVDCLQTVAILGKLLDNSYEYDEDPFSNSWEYKITSSVDSH